jgi:hypothetical protein
VAHSAEESKPPFEETDLDARVSLAIFPALFVPPAAPRQEKSSMVPSSTKPVLSLWLFRGTRSPWLLSAAILAVTATGCQTPQTNPYATTVAPPATGMAGQASPYGYNAAVPQGAAYPSGAPMPGPTMPAATTMGQTPPPATTPPPALPPGTQVPPATGAQPPASSWTWAQTSNTPPPQQWQQAGTQPPATMTQQGQQLAAPYQQQAAAQAQQYSAQAQQATNNTINGYQNQLNTQWQQANQQVQNGLQPAATQPPMTAPPTQPVVQQSQYPPQTSTNAWWPFSDPSQFPPARATPTAPASY